MKNQYFTFLLLFISSVSFSQRTNTKVLEKFNELKVYDRIVVTLVKSNENKLVISGDDKDEVSISNKNGLLKVRMKFDNFMDGDEAKGTLYYTEELTLLDVNENAKINSDETFKATNVEIKAQEGGVIDLSINTNNVYVRSVSGSEITLKGNSATQEISVNTGGKAYNEELKTKETEVVVMAGGRADVRATDNVIAKVKAGGSIYIHGNPKNISRDKVFGGKITEVD
jgi:hypothetical protein